MKANISRSILAFSFITVFCACNVLSPPAPTTEPTSTPTKFSIETITPTLVLTATITATSDIYPTPTQWLPFNPNIVNRGCQFTAMFPVNESKGLSQAEIAQRLFEIYLSHFSMPEVDLFCKLNDFKIISINSENLPSTLAAEQKVDFVTWAIFSVQVKELPTMWIGGNGEEASGGWIVNKVLIIGITKSDNEYILKIIGTGP